MCKEEQTDKVVQELYNLTKMFVRALQPKYYYQYRGDLDDLASEFFIQFITPKARSGEKKTLLDKFDEQVTTLPYLVKVCVVRKLIDASRANPQVVCSLDELVANSGDMFTPIAYSNRPKVVNKKLLRKVRNHLDTMDHVKRNKLFVECFDADSLWCDYITPAIKKVHSCPVQQVTDKTIVLYVSSHRVCIPFDVVDGHARGKYRPFCLTPDELTEVHEMVGYHSQFTKGLFEEYLQKCSSTHNKQAS